MRYLQQHQLWMEVMKMIKGKGYNLLWISGIFVPHGVATHNSRFCILHHYSKMKLYSAGIIAREIKHALPHLITL